MQSRLLSPDRLKNPHNLEKFKNILICHGVLGSKPIDYDCYQFSEVQKWEIVPLIFGLMPRKAIERPNYDLRIKPHIKEHLSNIGLSYDDEYLVHIIKKISDQYYETLNLKDRPKRKMGISDLRATKPDTYLQLKSEQNSRCAICGSFFNGETPESLDHIIPWRILGDIRDGSNWQILCEKCNTGKSYFLSCLQTYEFFNWMYMGDSKGVPSLYDSNSSESYSLRLRYAILSWQKECYVEGCFGNATNSSLSLKSEVESSLEIFDAYKVACDKHF